MLCYLVDDTRILSDGFLEPHEIITKTPRDPSYLKSRLLGYVTTFCI